MILLSGSPHPLNITTHSEVMKVTPGWGKEGREISVDQRVNKCLGDRGVRISSLRSLRGEPWLRSHLRAPPGWQACRQRETETVRPCFSASWLSPTHWCGSQALVGTPRGAGSWGLCGPLLPGHWRGVQGFGLHRVNEVDPASTPVHTAGAPAPGQRAKERHSSCPHRLDVTLTA